jgi:hypothetical protein
MDRNLTRTYQPHQPLPITPLGSIITIWCLCLMALWLVLWLIGTLA